MDNIKDVVKQVIGDIAGRQPQAQDRITEVWQKTIPKNDLEHTALHGLKDGVLSVRVESSAWLYHMKTRQHKILKQLQQEVPDLKKIKFSIGSIK